MDYVQADRYSLFSASVYTKAHMTSGVDIGKCFHGSIISPVCIGTTYRTTRSTLRFSGTYSGFLNLNNINHSKMSGCVIASPVVDGTIRVQDSIFGPMYDVGGSPYNVMTLSPLELYKASYGRYNDCAEGLWCMSVGICMPLANTYVAVVGYPDLKGKSTFCGYYSYTATRMLTTSDGFERRDVSGDTNIRTSQGSMDLVIDQYLASIMIGLDNTIPQVGHWNDSNSLVGTNEVMTLFNFENIDYSSVFPSGDRNPNWAELAREAYNSTAFFSGNGIAFLKDTASLKTAAAGTASLISTMLSKNASAKAVAKIFLAFHYGWKLYASDCKSLSKQIRRYNSLQSSACKCSSNYKWSVGNRNYSAFYHCYYIRDYYITSSLDKITSMLDLNLSLTNIWDLVPYSFVLDWFSDLSTTLGSLDSYYRMTQKHKIICTGRTIKCVAHLTGAQAGLRGWHGTCDLSEYSRQYSAHVVYPSLILSNNIQPLEHIVEGGALIVSKR